MLSTQFEAIAVREQIAHRIVRAVRAGVASFYRWHERRVTLRYLQHVDDHVLEDIGIRRSDILSAIYGRRNQTGV